MDKLLSAAQIYKNELDGKVFRLKAGKRGKELSFDIKFSEREFKHIAGLHKLLDIPVMRRSSAIIYRQILDGKTTYDDIKSSEFLSQMEDRLDVFYKIKDTLLNPNLMLRSSYGKFLGIDADYLLSKNVNEQSNVHLFLKGDKEGIVVPVTFFERQDNSYLSTNAAARWTVLSVEEITTPKADNLDKFHLSKALITLSCGDKKLLSELRRAVYDGDRQRFDRICTMITQRKISDVAERRAANDCMSYISSNFDAISTQSRCSAEGHVSHVLSSRMSSRPMAWTREGAGKVASLRAYMYNKGDFLTLIREGKKQQAVIKHSGYNSTVDMVDGIKGKTEQQPYSIPGIEHISGALASEIKYILKNF